ncbi:hypothetical protein ASPZODRAFT_63640 [Penicilliopsis zonata CBS 506.65]|uniref:non-specific serine/threonine protein kinase n=1 Tax=Penicilliopsis zonata CBS 506.65 TaxID=1073090 RepID=A0A1L9SK57_9EURO|nr:hypothetical protein ASPZODRAFT_63640 [Penicilliopsis zonata CBS 506.65]OJJ47547.1 hypothetical protein ASPZODRAFT_63640 [Penicilliopsis zonata CBS 506.65]
MLPLIPVQISPTWFTDSTDNSNGLHEDDHIGSNSTTPSGIATPQPDPADKRLPSIMHSFFQVGVSSTASRPSKSWSPKETSAAVGGDQPSAEEGAHTKDSKQSSGCTSASGSFVLLEREQASDTSRSSMLSADAGPEKLDLEGAALNPTTNLPTPPSYSACSLMQKDPDAALAISPDKGVGSILTALKSYLSSSTSSSSASPSESGSRRHTSHPVSSVSDDPVLASHFSNPSLSTAADGLGLPENLLLDHERPHLSMSSENLTKLTGYAAAGSRLKNTPPLTPRAMSNESPQADHQQPTPATSSPRSAEDSSQQQQHENCDSNQQQVQADDIAKQTDEITGKLNDVFRPQQSDSTRTGGPTVDSLKGKLFVKISEARGLLPGFDPYVVCVFEWNECISKGAQDADEEGHRLERDSGRPMAIPMRSRQSSNNSALDNNTHDHHKRAPVTDPHWNHEAVFDVLREESEIDVSVYDRYNHEAFLGHVRLSVNLKSDSNRLEGWFPLETRGAGDNPVSGEIHLEMRFEKTEKKQVGPNDFQILKLIGKGTFGQVYQVKKKDTQRIYAMKVLSKKVIIQKKEIAHTLGERNILVRTAMSSSPFIVGLKFSFQTPSDLYLVTDYMSGGELFWHLQKEGRFQEDRAKFYIAELILALQHLHDHDIVYRDLKPENILLDANGHIALCDFGLSKANLTKNDTTNTFCGTTEYLAPEVLLDEQGYTKMVDFWSLGVLVFEMCCGWSPFYAEDTQQMYKNIAFGKVRFPRDALSTEGRNFVKGLLNRNPKHRLGAKGDAKELMAHPFFDDIDWQALNRKEVIPPFKPKLKSDTDTSNFDPEFTTALETSASLNDRAAALANGLMQASTPLSPGMQANFKGFTFVNENSIDHHLRNYRGDRMDEDEDTWQRSHRSGNSTDHHRMSGIQGGDVGIFNVDDNFDV